MSTQHVLESIARTILDSNLYMTIGTADETGRPWVTPVYFASARYAEFYWISSPEATHSRNIAVRPQVSIVVYDSHAPVGTGQAVYLSAVAEELTDPDFDMGVGIYNGRFADPGASGVRLLRAEDLRAPAPYRLYRATASESWVLDPASSPDRRVPVSPAATPQPGV